MSASTMKKVNRKKSGGPFSLISPLQKSGYYTFRNPTAYLQLAVEEVGIPLTVKILDGELTDELHQGDILTLHKTFDVVKLECVKPSGEMIDIPAELEGIVNFLPIVQKDVYHTVEDVLTHHRAHDITWIVVTKPFVYQGYVYKPGVIFELIDEGGEDENKEFLAAEVYPGRLMVFLPLQIRGEFYKCNSPYHESERNLIDIKMEETPFLISPKVSTFSKQFQELTELSKERLLVIGKRTEKVLLASTFHDEQFFIHMFPHTSEIMCEILLGGIPVDILREDELKTIENTLLPTFHEKLASTKSILYEHAGIERTKSGKTKTMKLKKKDINAPKSLLDADYARYIEKPAALMKELGLNVGGFSEPPAIVRMKTIVRRPTTKKHEAGCIDCVAAVLENNNLDNFFLSEQIDSNLINKFDENDFIELGMEKDAVEKLYACIHNYSKSDEEDAET